MQIIFSPKQAKAARLAAQLSQGRVAADLGLNRSYLSLFESGKYIFDDATLRTLRDYFDSHGAVDASEADMAPPSTHDHGLSIADPPTIEADGIDGPQLQDGFLIPAGTDEDEVSLLLDEYARNRSKIEKLCRYDIRKHSFLFIDSSDVAEKTAEVLRLMARNFAIIETIQGHDTVQPWNDETRMERPATTGDFLSQMFSKMAAPGS